MLSRAFVGVVVILAAFVAAASAQTSCSVYGTYRCQVPATPPTTPPQLLGLEVCDYVTATTQLAWRLLPLGTNTMPCGTGRSCAAVPISGTNCINYVCALQPVCTSGARRCVNNGTGYQVCLSNGQWGMTVNCVAPNPFCNTTVQCAAAPPVCASGARRCVNGGYQVCMTNGQWGMTVNCVAPNPFCDPTTVQCSASPCPPTTPTTPCAPNSYQCQNPGGTGFCQCDNGGWVARPCAPTTACAPNDGSIVCARTT